MATEHLQNYIDGRWVDASTGDSFADIDPATGETIASVTKSATPAVDRAVDAARRASEQSRLSPAPKRGASRYLAGKLMLPGKDELAREMPTELGHVLHE